MIRCVSRYSSSLGYFQPGDVVTDPALAAALMFDSPGSFKADDAPRAAIVSDAAMLEAENAQAIRGGRRREKQ